MKRRQFGGGEKVVERIGNLAESIGDPCVDSIGKHLPADAAATDASHSRHRIVETADGVNVAPVGDSLGTYARLFHRF
jgi:hypothetical protein